MENELYMEEDIIVEEETAPKRSFTGLKIAAIGAAALGAGILLYKKVVKPKLEKRKAEKEEREECDFVVED